jgi:hypothetical protein
VRGTVTLLGNATVTDTSGTALGDKLFWDRDFDSVKVESTKRSTVSVDNLKKNRATNKKLEPCNAPVNPTNCESDE